MLCVDEQPVQLTKETSAWATATNLKQRGVDWQFKIDDAHVKLKSLYPKIQVWQSTRDFIFLGVETGLL